MKQAEVALATAKDDQATLLKGTDSVTLATAQADVDKKQLAVANAQADLAGAKLTAPFCRNRSADQGGRRQPGGPQHGHPDAWPT